MSKYNSSTFGAHRFDWTNGAVRRLRKDNQQAELSIKQDSGSTESNKPETNPETDKSYYEGPVKKKHSGNPVEPFLVTLELIEQMTNEASE